MPKQSAAQIPHQARERTDAKSAAETAMSTPKSLCGSLAGK
jgi:hypothetical protein